MSTTDEMNAHRALRLEEFLGQLPDGTDTDRRAYVIARGTKKSRLSQLLGEGFGERAGMTLAKKLKLRNERAFDQPIGTPFDAPPLVPAARQEVARYNAPCASAAAGIEAATRLIAETLLSMAEPQREAASITIKLLATAPEQWREVARIISGLAAQPGGSPASNGSDRPIQKTG